MLTTLDHLLTCSDVVITRCSSGHIIGIMADGKRISPESVLKDFFDPLPATHSRFDKWGIGSSLKLALFGFDAKQGFAVFRICHTSRPHYLKQKKEHSNYYQIGRDKLTGAVSMHPVSSASVHGALRATFDDPAVVVAGTQRWMWQCTRKQLDAALAAGLQHGNILMVKELGMPNGEELGTSCQVGSYSVVAQQIIRNNDGRTWAFAPSLLDASGQKSQACVAHGWYSVRIAQEAKVWDFTTDTKN